MGRSDVTEQEKDLELEVIGLASANICILLTGTRHEAMALARRIHGLGRGRPGRFKTVNCGWPESR